MRLRQFERVLWLLTVSLVYFVTAGSRAICRPLWFDELVTWHISQLPDFPAMWRALVSGIDQQLPLMHLSVRVCHALFGDGNLATRLPMLLGFWAMMVGIYLFLAKRLPWQYAVVGMVIPAFTYAWPYAFEARAYGMALGAAALTLVSWQRAADGVERGLALPGITIGIAVALGVQSLMVLVLIPFALGEAVRTLRNRRVDWPVWVAFAAAAPVTLMYPPVMAPLKNFHFPGAQPSVFGFTRFYQDALKEAIFPLLVACIVGILFARKKEMRQPESSVPWHEWAAIVGFLLTPLPFYLAGLVSTRFVVFPRYGIVSMIGVGCVLPILLHRLAGSGQRVATAILAVVVCWFGISKGKDAYVTAGNPATIWRQDHEALERALARNSRMALSSPMTFMEAEHYLSVDQMERIYWIVPEDQQTDGWAAVWKMIFPREKQQFRLKGHLISWQEFSEGGRSFDLLTEPNTGWWFKVLPAEGWRLSPVDVEPGTLVFSVEKAGRSGP